MAYNIRSLSLFFPAYYDEKNIGLVVDSAIEVVQELELAQYEINIIEDGSPDNTDQVVDELALSRSNVRAYHHEHNRGYGATLKEGFQRSSLEWVFYTDGDNQFDLSELKLFVGSISGSKDIVIGFRKRKQYTLFRRLTSWSYNLLVRILFGLEVKDVNCAFKLIPRQLFDEIDISSKDGFIDAEILLKAQQLGYRFIEIGVTHRPRVSGVATGTKPSVVLGTIRETFRFWFQTRLRPALPIPSKARDSESA